MQTSIAEKYKNDSQVAKAEEILRKCVHCGFCLATCPTYNLLGDEQDSPRGRIYLIKQVLEGEQPTASTQLHLDRCLTCRNCETTCPSGVEYGHLVDIGREIVDRTVERPFSQRIQRWLIRAVLPYPKRIGPLVKLGQSVRSWLPAKVRTQIPAAQEIGHLPVRTHARKVLLPGGCVQPSMTPNTNAAMTRVLDRLGIQVVQPENAGCCGAINYHLSDTAPGKDFMRRNIDAWWPALEAGAEAIVVTASGCGALIRDYGYILSDDPAYREKAARVSELVRDPAELLSQEDPAELAAVASPRVKVAYHPPCTLQHGQKVVGVTEKLLAQFGFDLTPVPDAHTCCGSAGTYSILQKTLSAKLKTIKVESLESGVPDVIATSNIGCQIQIQSGTKVPVRHWIELIDEAIDHDKLSV